MEVVYYYCGRQTLLRASWIKKTEVEVTMDTTEITMIHSSIRWNNFARVN